jgi:hypothetical protein
MSKARICPLMVILFLCLHPFSYSQKGIAEANLGQVELNSDPIVDVHGNLLFFRTVASKSAGVQTEVTLISPSATTTSQTYPGILTPIGGGEKAVYAIQRMPAASTAAPTSATLSLVALVTTPEPLPPGLVDYSLSGKFRLFKIASGVLTDGSDVIYLDQNSSHGRSVVVLKFDGKDFEPVSGSPVPLS